jgi:glutamate-ammonia-ligase adenylyltransferase
VQVLQHEHAHDAGPAHDVDPRGARGGAQAGLVPDAAARAWPHRGASRVGCGRRTRCCRGRRATCCPPTAAKLDGIGRLLEYPARSATLVEEEWLRTARRARRDFEKLFYG